MNWFECSQARLRSFNWLTGSHLTWCVSLSASKSASWRFEWCGRRRERLWRRRLPPAARWRRSWSWWCGSAAACRLALVSDSGGGRCRDWRCCNIISPAGARAPFAVASAATTAAADDDDGGGGGSVAETERAPLHCATAFGRQEHKQKHNNKANRRAARWSWRPNVATAPLPAPPRQELGGVQSGARRRRCRPTAAASVAERRAVSQFIGFAVVAIELAGATC